MSKFDLILLFIFALIVAVCGANVWLIVHGYEQFTAGFWTFATAVCAGEVVTFSLYRIAKGRGVPKSIKGKHSIIDDLENDEKEQK
ncbi:hypothetical protein [Gordonibacter urolithinfaciens]|uniref:hypothetical protein n=1 Tax=Gordonibacter urolithinfaciens TaxID=1335613 RepID=UPI003AAF0C91